MCTPRTYILDLKIGRVRLAGCVLQCTQVYQVSGLQEILWLGLLQLMWTSNMHVEKPQTVG